MNNQKVLFYFLVIFISLLFITTCSNIYNSKVNEIKEGFQQSNTCNENYEQGTCEGTPGCRWLSDAWTCIGENEDPLSYPKVAIKKETSKLRLFP